MLGERTQAFQYLEQALEEGIAPVRIESDPWLKDLRTDPEYASLRQRIPEREG